jgi:hypothetical protein
MLRWLKQLLRRGERPDESGVDVALSLVRPEVPVGRRRVSTTVEEFESHLAKCEVKRNRRC